MSQALIIIHLVVCVALIMIVLLQTGKGADMGAAFGGGSSQTLFGSSGGATFLSKLTTVAAIIFMVTSLGLAYYSSRRTQGSIMIDAKPPIEEQAQPQTGLPPSPGSQPQQAAPESQPAPAKSE